MRAPGHTAAPCCRWEGGLTSAKELQQWLFSRMPDLTLQISGPEALQMFMAAGSSAAAGAKAGKVLLLSSKQEAPAAFKALAVGMAGKARLSFGWIAPGSAFADKAKVDFKVSEAPAAAQSSNGQCSSMHNDCFASSALLRF